MAQRIVPWETGITAGWYRANELIDMRHHPLAITLIEEHTEQHWQLTFETIQAFRWTTEEAIWPLPLELFPDRGGFFEVEDSDWIAALGNGQVHFLDRSRHFVICCYDDIIEVVAWTYAVTKIPETGYPEGEGRIILDPNMVYDGPAPTGNDPVAKKMRMRLASRDSMPTKQPAAAAAKLEPDSLPGRLRAWLRGLS